MSSGAHVIRQFKKGEPRQWVIKRSWFQRMVTKSQSMQTYHLMFQTIQSFLSLRVTVLVWILHQL